MSTKKLKIGLVFDDSLDTDDGVQQYVRVLGRWLVSRGHDVKFLVGETKNADPDIQPLVHSLSRNMTFKGNGNKMFLPIFSSTRKLNSVLKQEKFDIIHAMMPTNPLMGSRVINRAKGSKVVGTFHMVGGNWFINMGAHVLALVQRRTLKKFDSYLSVSPAAQAYERQYFGIESEVSPNMVELSRFKAGKQKEFLRGEKGTIVFLGRLVERKGAAHLLQALRLLHQSGKLNGVVVHICGDGQLRSELEAYVNTHQLSSNVIFHGHIPEDEKADYLASADVAVFPATGGEAFGIVLIEAMASGKSVVLAGDNDGYRTVMDGNKDHLFNPKDRKRLAALIDRAINDAKLRKEAIRWQDEVVAKYDVENVGRQIEKIYKTLLS